ncbi:MAG: 4-deoxy-4-formamido-L-arabinose-phosphoundecaprenol deformylase [Phycisphaerales bacterium]|nr:4-deoxy-4-formamido-L-arabinose-phosphoundecaprenol deformylase [Phycisphaerales bacterium]
MPLALRIDVDTYRGTRDGVPRLLKSLDRFGVRATWFFTVGPDNMGRHAWRLLRPAFAAKMLRSRAASLYGWDILLRGTLWRGPQIGRALAATIRLPIAAGHEFGVHAWDHHRWQVGVESLSDEELASEFDRAVESLTEIAKSAPVCSASPGWRCSDRVLRMKALRPFEWHSDCRGDCTPFYPVVDGVQLKQAQISVDLPTYDEAVGRDLSDEAFNLLLLAKLADGKPHVLTIHAESEGGRCAELFDRFLERVLAEGHKVQSLGEHLSNQRSRLTAQTDIDSGRVCWGKWPGREGFLAVRAAAD